MSDETQNQDQQIIMDNDFWNASPKDQKGYLSSIDPGFGNADPKDQDGYIQHLKQQRESYAPPMPKPHVDMKPSYLGTAIENSPSNADPHNPANANPEIMNRLDPKTREEMQDRLLSGAITTLPLSYGEGAAMGKSLLKPVSSALFRGPQAAKAAEVGRLVDQYGNPTIVNEATPAVSPGLVPRMTSKAGQFAVEHPFLAKAGKKVAEGALEGAGLGLGGLGIWNLFR